MLLFKYLNFCYLSILYTSLCYLSSIDALTETLQTATEVVITKDLLDITDLTIPELRCVVVVYNYFCDTFRHHIFVTHFS